MLWIVVRHRGVMTILARDTFCSKSTFWDDAAAAADDDDDEDVYHGDHTLIVMKHAGLCLCLCECWRNGPTDVVEHTPRLSWNCQDTVSKLSMIKPWELLREFRATSQVKPLPCTHISTSSHHCRDGRTESMSQCCSWGTKVLTCKSTRQDLAEVFLGLNLVRPATLGRSLHLSDTWYFLLKLFMTFTWCVLVHSGFVFMEHFDKRIEFHKLPWRSTRSCAYSMQSLWLILASLQERKRLPMAGWRTGKCANEK